MLSSRGRRAIKPALPYFGKHIQAAEDLYDAETNPGGYISLCIAEARGSFASGRMDEKLASVRQQAIGPATAAYTNMLGTARLRRAFGAMISRTVLRDQLALDPEQLCVSSGCGAVLLQLAMLLLDPDDGVLLPTPTYAALYNDIGTLAYGRVVDVPTEASGYRLTREGLEAALATGRAGGPMKMLLLLNPHNPLGIVYSAGELRMARDFCAYHGLHLVVDEVYANSVYAHPADPTAAGDGVGTDGRAVFVSMVELCAQDAGVLAPTGTPPQQQPTPPAASAGGRHAFLGDTVHVLWGFSKDFAMSGYRTGVLYTHNAPLLEALSNVNYFTTVSNDTQEMLAGVMEDAPWTDGYLAHCRAQLRAAYAALAPELAAAGIPHVPCQAGMFAWLDLRALILPPPPPASRRGPGRPEPPPDPWAAERALTDDLFAHARILFTPGEYCHAAEPGFYRCCFAWMSPAAVGEAFRRLREFAAKRTAGGE